MWDVDRWETLSHHESNCGREEPTSHRARATNLTWGGGGAEALTSIPKKKKHRVYLPAPSASDQLIIQRKKMQSPRHRREREGERKAEYSCAAILRTQTWSFLQKLEQVKYGELGKEIEEFLRPEKRGKHVTELHESFIRL